MASKFATASVEFHSRLNDMRRDGKMCDVKIFSCGDPDDRRGEFTAHTAVLSAASPHFEVMFNSDFVEGIVGEVKLDMDTDVVEQLLEYMYTYNLEINEKNAARLLPEAVYLQLTQLQKQCHSFIIDHLTPSNCLDMWQLARFHSYDDIEALAWYTAYMHLDDVVGTPSFAALAKEDLLLLLIERRLHCAESSVFTGVVNWVRADPDRKADMTELFRLVRLSRLDKNFLLDTVGREPLVLENHQCLCIYHNAIIVVESLGKTHFPSFEEFVRGDMRAIGEWQKGQELNNGQNMRVERHCSAVSFHDTIYCIGKEHAVCLDDAKWVSVAMPTAAGIHWHLCVFNGDLYAVGANDSTFVVEKYSSASDAWTQVHMASSNEGEVESATVFQDHIYIHRTDVVYKFDPFHPDVCEAVVSKMGSGVRLAVLDDTLFCIGHIDDTNTHTTVRTYNAHSKKWANGIPLPAARRDVSVAVAGGHIVVAGGEDDDGDKTSDVWAFNGDKWIGLPALQQPRARSGLAVLDDVVYAIGGEGEESSVETLRIEM